jgi:hypothetical protein
MAAKTVQGGIKMKAQLVTVSQLKDMVEGPISVAVFRQTRNWQLKRWNCVQRRLEDGVWRRILHDPEVINHQGWSYALWRLKDVIMKKRDAHGRRIWYVSMHKIRHGVYMTYYLVCKRIHYSISGIY